jgi:lipoprotein NlpD
MSPMNTLRNEANSRRLTLLHRVLCLLAMSAVVSGVSTLSGCATRLDNAPVVERSVNEAPVAGGPSSTAPAAVPAPVGPPPPGYYRVKPGDTLYRIALNNSQSYRDIASWNNLTNPNQIEVDQLLRVVPPGSNPLATVPGVSTAPVAGNGVQSAPLISNQSMGALNNNGYGVPPPVTIPPQTANAGAGVGAAAGATPPAGSDSLSMIWPAHGPILNTFDDAKNKGVDIGGALGDPVVAVADGRVVYAGSGLRGYGNLIIVKHDATFLTAYAHNQALLVKEGDAVMKGQKIASMGNSDADRVMLHFEVRKQGKPVDPMKYLPAH